MKKEMKIVKIIDTIMIWIFGLLSLLIITNPFFPGHSGPYPIERLNLNNIWSALSFYQERYNYLPYSPENSERALYLLKSFVRVSSFNYPYKNISYGNAYWDDNNKEIRNGFYEYVNKPNLTVFLFDNYSPIENVIKGKIIVVAEKDVGQRRRMFITQNGYLDYTRPNYNGTVAGKRVEEVCQVPKGNTLPWIHKGRILLICIFFLSFICWRIGVKLYRKNPDVSPKSKLIFLYIFCGIFMLSLIEIIITIFLS